MPHAHVYVVVTTDLYSVSNCSAIRAKKVQVHTPYKYDGRTSDISSATVVSHLVKGWLEEGFSRTNRVG